MHQRTVTCGILFLLLYICGCTSGGMVQYSNPSLIKTAAGDLRSNGVLQLDDISISIRPQNTSTDVGATGFILPVFPTKKSKMQDNSLELFDIIIQLEALSEGHAFDPGKVLLVIGDEQYEPTVTMGPFAGNRRLYAAETTMPGHKWECSALVNGTASILASAEGSLDPGRVHFTGQKCFVLRYPVFTLEPNQDFFLIVNGLEENDVELAVPMVSFSQSSQMFIR